MRRNAKLITLIGAAFFAAAALWVGGSTSFAQDQVVGDVVRGGQLYQAWDKVLGVNLPTSNQAIWQEIAPEGSDIEPRSWRCVTCHGWDYRGSSGWAPRAVVNRAGIPGLFAMVAEPQRTIIAWLDGTINAGHDFSEYFSETDYNDLSAFLTSGLVAPELIADLETQRVLGTVDTGEEVYQEYCLACHGVDGSKINFGPAAAPEYLADITLQNPWRVAHVVRFGHLGINLPSAEELELGFGLQLDLLAYTQTLPQASMIGSPDYPVIVYDTQAHTEMLAYTSIVLAIIVLGGAIWVTKRKA
jgi:mono/diheme cytochrome c family protein